MEMMKKLMILVAAIILGGLGYAAYQRYSAQPSDNVQIQKTKKTIDKGSIGYACPSGSQCLDHP